MKFHKTILQDAYLIELEDFNDERGTFSRQFCKKEFLSNGIDIDICQCNISKNYKANTLRGLHFQKAPFLESKIVSCFKGAFFDVIVDLRQSSPTYLKWEAFELTEQNNYMLYIPPEFAHGFQTLVDDTVVFYQLGNYFEPAFYDGLRWDDPKLGINWPDCPARIISEKDKSYKLL